MSAPPKPLLNRPVALLADVHGDLAALDAVLAELDRRDVGALVVAGDLLFGGEEPLGVWRRLAERRAHLVRGLSDTALSTLDPGRLVATTAEEQAKRDRFLETRAQVGELVLRALLKLPEQLRFPLADGSELMVCHGSPIDPSIELGFDATDEEVIHLVGDDPADLIAVGGAHVPFDRALDATRVVGLGSVGETPGGRISHFAILTPRPEGALLERGFVELDAGAMR